MQSFNQVIFFSSQVGSQFLLRQVRLQARLSHLWASKIESLTIQLEDSNPLHQEAHSPSLGVSTSQLYLREVKNDLLLKYSHKWNFPRSSDMSKVKKADKWNFSLCVHVWFKQQTLLLKVYLKIMGDTHY